eukprot:CAMPEP_0181231076 /NCGR_PEP_ID=MMETSP1096-20121128/34877_1 /TAXON_ID=156174 ORGANISM="Chrysochromulina ericina, Strain CCMP281" /NCGR_SAMPLE_ID=MMETSP1096 /ASSEMBLY_ACC=CAM_ASM_000453 /LENGTH=134 /DNA_ID=CAMNT_0023325021 /DNA_START=107 /DNA_END=512 /DNA_ORIENTATION=+
MIDFDATPSSGAYARARWEQYMRDEQLDHEPVLDLAAAFQLFNTAAAKFIITVVVVAKAAEATTRSHAELESQSRGAFAVLAVGRGEIEVCGASLVALGKGARAVVGGDRRFERAAKGTFKVLAAQLEGREHAA